MDSAPQTALVRDESFYFEDDPMAIFLVEDRLFKVHRHFFIQGSTIFRDMFALTGGQDNTTVVEKTSEEKVVPLPDVTVKEFQTLLRFFYATTPPLHPIIDTLVLTFDLDEKLALLRIAHRFAFDHIFNYISEQYPWKLEEIPVVDRIRLGDKYDLNRWLFSAYEEILDRDSLGSDMSEEEVDALGANRVVKILKAHKFMLNESLEGIKEHRSHGFTSCHQCGNQMRTGCGGRQPLKLHGPTPTATVVEKYLLPPLFG